MAVRWGRAGARRAPCRALPDDLHAELRRAAPGGRARDSARVLQVVPARVEEAYRRRQGEVHAVGEVEGFEAELQGAVAAGPEPDAPLDDDVEGEQARPDERVAAEVADVSCRLQHERGGVEVLVGPAEDRVVAGPRPQVGIARRE